MTRLVLIWLLLAAGIGACAERERLNVNCEWNEDHATSLSLQNATQQRHLNHDALVAEEIAIRYADLHRGHRSGHFEGADEYARTRDGCLATLSRAIVAGHGVTPMQVRDAVGRRDRRVDLTIIVTVAALYIVAVSTVMRWLFRRFPRDEWWRALPASLATSAMVSATVVMFGELGSSIVEMIRVGDTHLSYRALRIPWARHRSALFIGGLLLFWLIALITHRDDARMDGTPNT